MTLGAGPQIQTLRQIRLTGLQPPVFPDLEIEKKYYTETGEQYQSKKQNHKH
jgi:hypothetical protein